MPHVFISYVRENSSQVDRLVKELVSVGIQVWLDRNEIMPGARWKGSIKNAISEGHFFLACFSTEYAEKAKTYMNEEITVAIEQLRQRHTDRTWFIPVKLTACQIPYRSIGGGETLEDLQYVELFHNWSEGIERIISAIRPKKNVITNAQYSYDETIFQQRMKHFQAEKYFIARKFADSLVARIKHITEKLDKHILLFLDSGTSIYPFFKFIGECAAKATVENEQWTMDRRLTIVTNNLPGIQELLRTKSGTNGKYRADLPIDCKFLPGTASSTYLSVTGPETLSAIESYKNIYTDSIFLSLLASNYIKISTGAKKYPVMLVRGHEHPPIKKKLIDISDESYVVAALGKVVSYDVKDLNKILGYTSESIPSTYTPYCELESQAANENLKIITTCRKKNRLMYKISCQVQEHLKAECRLNHNSFVKAPLGKTHHLMFMYDELPDKLEDQLAIEIPHESIRNKFMV